MQAIKLLLCVYMTDKEKSCAKLSFPKFIERALMKPNLPIFPITEWEVETSPADELIFVRFTFLSDVRQCLDDADVGNPYVMEIEQVRELRDALTRAIERVDNYKGESSFYSHCGEADKTRR
jgi:hypothetical protein